MMPQRSKKTALIVTQLAAAIALYVGMAPANAQSTQLDRLLSAKAGQAQVRISPVRMAALRTTARTLGAQTGLIERAKEVAAEVEKRRVRMEREFRFGDLVIGAGVLPPVIVRADNAVSVTNNSMRLAGSVYKLVQPARFFSGAPSWRDWLLLGLPSDSDTPEIPTNEQLLPRDQVERAFWEQEVRAAYISGRAQAQEIFEHNLSQLEEVYIGMRTFYELYQRNMVSAPVIAKSQEMVTQDDPNTIVVGDTLFRITQPSEFKINTAGWKALAATPRTKDPLPVVFNYDPEQVKHAFEVARQIKARNEAQAAAREAEARRNRPLFGSAAKAVQQPQVAAPIAPAQEPAQAGVIRTTEIKIVQEEPRRIIDAARPLFSVPTN